MNQKLMYNFLPILYFVASLHHVFFFLIFYWIIVFQYCSGFCHASTWISHRYTYSPSLLNLPPMSTPSHLCRLLHSVELNSLCHTANSHWLSILHMVMYMFPCYSQFIPLSTSSTVSINLFSISAVSIAALQINS